MAEQTKFSIMKNGYNRYEVDDEIERLSKELETALGQVENYRRLTETANEQLTLIKEKYQKLTNQIEIREKAADDISRIALKEANRIISSAQNNADSIVQEAIATARVILIEIARISNEASDVKADMQTKINELQKTLDEFEIPTAMDEKWLKG
ncbi:MAG: DivIVA domain-containing protein [Erysipelotrichaceae bacterium]|nr:DivIVA domain-containing protein [Erysipelotrichaceae bacterium]